MTIDTYIFDIDHTLYPFSQGVEEWFGSTISTFIGEKLGVTTKRGYEICEDYYQTFGSTLPGLMYHHDITAKDFFDAKGKVPLEHIGVDEAGLAALIKSSKRKIAFTNASRRHGEHVLAHLGIRDQFEALFGLDDVGYWGKPFRRSFERVFNAANIVPTQTVFFEDSPRNLVYPHSLGMKTALIGEQHFKIGDAPEHITIHTRDLATAIEQANEL